MARRKSISNIELFRWASAAFLDTPLPEDFFAETMSPDARSEWLVTHMGDPQLAQQGALYCFNFIEEYAVFLEHQLNTKNITVKKVA